jgi:predicted secreted hydrolase
MAVDLTLSPGKGPALHGQRGFSRKGSQPGNASHYYSFSRMPTRGRLEVAGRNVEVEGSSWMDHEFGTSFLEERQVGWDWFSMQFEDGTDLMLFQLRRSDGKRDPNSSGTLIGKAGATRAIAQDEFDLIPGRTWKSAASGASYPVEWRIRIPKADIELEIRAAPDSQELQTGRSTGVTYWEGAIVVQGRRGGTPVRGRGYLEMTGYSGAPMSRVFR